MAEHKGNLLLAAQIGDPIPGEQGLNGDHHIGPKRRQRFEQELLVGRNLRLQDGAGLIDNAKRQKSGVQSMPQ
jgi:hypothetical protein